MENHEPQKRCFVFSCLLELAFFTSILSVQPLGGQTTQDRPSSANLATSAHQNPGGTEAVGNRAAIYEAIQQLMAQLHSAYGTDNILPVRRPVAWSAASASTSFAVLHSFSNSDGSEPWGALIQSSDGQFYGTTSGGGTFGQGAIFRIDSTGNLVRLHSFAGSGGAGPEGTSPVASLVEGVDGNFYGTAGGGGSGNSGTIFKISPSGSITILHSFSGSDGDGPAAPLIQAKDGFFYGTTAFGGNLSCKFTANATIPGCGTIFRIDSSGNFTSLHSFSGPDGVFPLAALLQANDGSFYGTTASGGTAAGGGMAFGTVFRMDSSGDITVLHSFLTSPGASEGGELQAAVIQGADGNFYGTSSAGGNSTSSGTIFRMDASGNLTTLYFFSGSDGASPTAPLIQTPDGNFYGTTSGGGIADLVCDVLNVPGCGTLFELNSSGVLTILHEFAGSQTDGSIPHDAPILGTDGNLYGTTEFGGASNIGTIFQLSGLGPTALPLLMISSTHVGNFTQGQSDATYTVVVSNGASAAPTNGPVQVTDILPEGLTLVSMSGTGWSCVGNVCTRGDVLTPGASFAPITVTVNIASDAPSQVTNQVSVSGGGSATASASDPTTVTAAPAGPSISSGAVLNAASNLPGPIAPGSIAVAYGSFLLESSSSADKTPWPITLGGLSAKFGSTEVPLYYVSGSQVNFQVPWELTNSSQSLIAPTVEGETGAGQTVSIAPFAPGIFTTNSQGTGQGAITDISGHLVDSTNPAVAGTTVIEIYCTGLGPVSNQPATGSPAPVSPLAETPTTPTVTIGGTTATVLFSGLAPGYVGLYQINAQVPAMVASGTAVPIVISIGGATSNAATIAVQSQLGSGSLQIQISGVPAGANPSITITSAYQNGFSTTVTTNEQIQVPAGAYTVVPNSITVGTASYGAFPGQQTVFVAPGSVGSAQVAYTVVLPLTTKTLDQQGVQSLSVSLDGNTLTLPSSSTVAQSLSVGDVLAVGVTPSSPNGLLRKIVSVNQGNSQIVATTAQATLADAFQQANFSFTTALNARSVQAARALRRGVRISSRARHASSLFTPLSDSGSLQLPCTSDSTIMIEMFDTPIVEDSSGSITVNGDIEVCPSLEFDWSIGGFPPGLNSLKATATLGEDAHVNLTGAYDTSFQEQAPIAVIATDPITVFVGPVPIVLTPTVTFFVGASGDVNAGFSFGVTQTASVTGGIAYENGQVSPIFPTPTNMFATDPVGLDASLSIKGYVGFTLDVDVDGVLSPEFSPDAFLSLDVNLQNNPWWALTGGVEGSASVDVSIFGIANLANFSFPDLFQFSAPIAQASGAFLSSSGDPVVNAAAPDTAVAGSSSLSVSLTGSNFVPGATVNFNGSAISSNYVGPNQMTATVPANDLALAGVFPLTITNPGSSGGSSQPVNFTVKSAGGSQAPHLTGLTLSPTSVVGGNTVTGTVVLSGPAPSNGTQITISSNNKSAVVPDSITVPAGQPTTTFDITTTAVTSSQTATVSASLGNSNLTAVLTISPSSPAPVVTEFPVPTSGSWPDGITTGSDGALWFTETFSGKVGRITTDGVITEYPVSPGPAGITAGPDGALWFAEFVGKIGRITTNGQLTEYPVLTASSGPTGIVTGPDGNIWFTEASANQTTNAIGQITMSGMVTEYPVPTPHSAPEWITAGPDGALWFTELNGNKIGRIATNGTITEYTVPTTTQLSGIVSGPDGALWFAENVGKLGRITTTGAVTEYPATAAGLAAGPGITVGPDGALWYGGTGRMTTAGVGTHYPGPPFSSFPYGMAAGPDGAVWFTEYYGNNIARVALDPTTIVTPPLQGLWLSSATVSSGNTFNLTIALAGPAPPGGVQVGIQSAPNVLQLSSPVTILAGQTTATVTVTAPSVTSSVIVNVTATETGSSPLTTSLNIMPASPVNEFENSGFDIYGTLSISGQAISAELQTMPLSDAIFGILSDLGGSLTGITILFDQQGTASGTTLTYTGADPTSYYVTSSGSYYSDFTAATLSLTVPSPTVGATVSATLQFSASGTTFSGTFTGTISTVSGP